MTKDQQIDKLKKVIKTKNYKLADQKKQIKEISEDLTCCRAHIGAINLKKDALIVEVRQLKSQYDSGIDFQNTLQKDNADQWQTIEELKAGIIGLVKKLH